MREMYSFYWQFETEFKLMCLASEHEITTREEELHCCIVYIYPCPFLLALTC